MKRQIFIKFMFSGNLMNKTLDKLKPFIRPLILIAILTGMIFYLKTSGILRHMSSVESFRAYIEGYGDKSYIIFFVFQFISVLIAPIPSNISTLVGGAVFGVWKSFLISISAIVSGSIVLFFLARLCGRPFVEYFINREVISKYEKYILSQKGELFIIMMFLLPFFPDDIIGFLVGLSSIKFSRYLIIILLTRPWGILFSSIVGGLNIKIPLWVWGLIILPIIFILVKRDRIEENLINRLHRFIFKKNTND